MQCVPIAHAANTSQPMRWLSYSAYPRSTSDDSLALGKSPRSGMENYGDSILPISRAERGIRHNVSQIGGMTMKVIDKIRAMSADELATWVQEFCACEYCELRAMSCFNIGLTPQRCVEATKKHLESEVESDEEEIQSSRSHNSKGVR